MNFNSQYLETVRKVLVEGEYVTGRNSRVLQVFCPLPIVVKDVRKDFPILSVRKVPFYKAALETFFFLSGESEYEFMPKTLRDTWWEPWALKAEERNSWGKFYSTQWRRSSTDGSTDKESFDQWENLIQDLCDVVSTGIVNRKMVVSLWRRQDAMPEYTTDPACLDCCHSTALIFNLVPKYHQDDLDSGYHQEYYLDLHHTQRSLDLLCGTASDLIYSSLIMQLLCNEVADRLYNGEAGPYIYPRKLVFSPSNTHIYESHIAQAKQLLVMNSNVKSYESVTLELQGPIRNFTHFKSVEDVKQVAKITGYKPVSGEYEFQLLG